MLIILHAADFHLDSPFSGLTAAQAAQRRQELRQLPARLAQLVQTEQADLVLLPGDLFDGERVYPETVAALAQALGEMAVPVFIAPGNHDFYGPQSPYARVNWPGNVHIFTTPDLESVELPDLNCVVHGCAFTAPRRGDDPLAGFSASKDGKLHLLCIHGEVAQGGWYAPIAPASLAACGARYAALGHIHAATSGKQGDTLWAYPGCPEGRGFDELGEKGVLWVQVDGDAVSTRFLPVCRRQYRVEAVGLKDFEAVLPVQPSPDLVRFRLTGESESPLNVESLTRLAAPQFFHVELRDETTLPQNLWARSGEDSLTGLFLRRMKALLDGAGDEERPRLLLAARFGLAALEGGEDPRP